MFVVEIQGVNPNLHEPDAVGGGQLSELVSKMMRDNGLTCTRIGVRWEEDPNPDDKFFRNQRQEMVEWLNSQIASVVMLNMARNNTESSGLFTNEGNINPAKAVSLLRDEWAKRFSGRRLPITYYADVYRQVAAGWGLEQDGGYGIVQQRVDALKAASSSGTRPHGRSVPKVFLDDAMNRRCVACERLERQCICEEGENDAAR